MIIDDLVKVLLRLLGPGHRAMAYTEQHMARLSGKESKVVTQEKRGLDELVLQSLMNPCELTYEKNIILITGIIDYSIVANQRVGEDGVPLPWRVNNDYPPSRELYDPLQSHSSLKPGFRLLRTGESRRGR